MKKYKFREYDPKFTKLFEKEKMKLNMVFPNAKIEHIGSTSVNELGGKGIIDVLISVPKKEIEKIKQKLIKAGYTFKPKAGDKERFFFERNYGLIKKRRVHLQLTSDNSDIWKSAIKFRDTLRKNNRLKTEYSLIKSQAINLGKEGKEYREHKSKFIKKVLSK